MVEVVTISMDRTLKDLLDRHCSLNQCGRSEIVRRAIMRYISPEEIETAPVSEETKTPPEVLSPVESLAETKTGPSEKPETSEIEAEEVSERVKQILAGKIVYE